MRPDQLASTLAGIQERNNKASYTDPISLAVTADDVPLLLAAIDKTLKLADEWRAVGCTESAEEEALMWQRIECGEALREAISRALTGQETGE